MLTRAQIQRLSQRNRIGMFVQERDYIQHLLLYALYARTQDLSFKGGTAIRIVFGGNRFSEDLDFNAGASPDRTKTLWLDVLKELELFGVQATIRNEWTSGAGYSFDVSFRGPLYDGRDRSKGKVRVDINLRPEEVVVARTLISSEYDDVRPFVVTTLTPEQIMAEKLRALMVRSKPRDVYDIWLLSSQGIEVTRELLQKKLDLYDIKFSPDDLHSALDDARRDWERDLSHLLPSPVPWEMISTGMKRVIAALSEERRA